ncbi:MBL fold metallo-hydrolase [Catellatospora tritici]|uniref:MBL fold metallo-hydrolase n=1 Tax=Catellatospora tritici TaxID=2851566 RepID=UPI0027E019B7|nr:MBL fold metallo-hydrolase [Catellatospora tritici]
MGSASSTPGLVEIADGVFVYLQPDGGWCLNNAGVVLDGTGLAVVDTAATSRRATALREAIRARTAVPPRLLVNTHHHGDHTFGNFVFAPESVIVAHEEARQEMADSGLGLTGLWPDVDWGPVEVTLPAVTFRDELRLHIGDIRVELLHLGPAHTTNDVVVAVPDRGVVFVGDIAMAGVTPFTLMGSVEGSLRAIERLRKLGLNTIVCGHGPVTDQRVLDETEAYLTWLQRLARDGVTAGLSPLELSREADLGEFADLLDSERLVGNLHRAYAELGGAVLGAPLDVVGIFGEMVDFHGGLPTCHA